MTRAEAENQYLQSHRDNLQARVIAFSELQGIWLLCRRAESA